MATTTPNCADPGGVFDYSQADALTYVKMMGMGTLFGAVIKDIVKEKPADPISYMIEKLGSMTEEDYMPPPPMEEEFFAQVRACPCISHTQLAASQLPTTGRRLDGRLDGRLRRRARPGGPAGDLRPQHPPFLIGAAAPPLTVAAACAAGPHPRHVLGGG